MAIEMPLALEMPCLTFRVVDIPAIVAGEVSAILVRVLDAILLSGCKKYETSECGSHVSLIN
jgi:hypothetical protein